MQKHSARNALTYVFSGRPNEKSSCLGILVGCPRRHDAQFVNP